MFYAYRFLYHQPTRTSDTFIIVEYNIWYMALFGFLSNQKTKKEYHQDESARPEETRLRLRRRTSSTVEVISETYTVVEETDESKSYEWADSEIVATLKDKDLEYFRDCANLMLSGTVDEVGGMRPQNRTEVDEINPDKQLRQIKRKQ